MIRSIPHILLAEVMDPNVILYRALIQIDFPLERLMPLVDTFRDKHNDEVVPRILEVCIELDKVRSTMKTDE